MHVEYSAIMPHQSVYALTDDFSTTVLSDLIYQENSVRRLPSFVLINETVKNHPDQSSGNRPLPLGILLGMRCSRPRLVPVPFIGGQDATKCDLNTWASVMEEVKEVRTDIRSMDDKPIIIIYEDQNKVPDVYGLNGLLSDSVFLWKGNVLLMPEEGDWHNHPFLDDSWIDGVKMTLSKL